MFHNQLPLRSVPSTIEYAGQEYYNCTSLWAIKKYLKKYILVDSLRRAYETREDQDILMKIPNASKYRLTVISISITASDAATKLCGLRIREIDDVPFACTLCDSLRTSPVDDGTGRGRHIWTSGEDDVASRHTSQWVAEALISGRCAYQLHALSRSSNGWTLYGNGDVWSNTITSPAGRRWQWSSGEWPREPGNDYRRLRHQSRHVMPCTFVWTVICDQVVCIGLGHYEKPCVRVKSRIDIVSCVRSSNGLHMTSRSWKYEF